MSRARKTHEALERLAWLYRYGGLHLDTDPAGFLGMVCEELEALRGVQEAAAVVVDEMIDIGPHGPELVDALKAHAAVTKKRGGAMSKISISTAELATLRMVLKSARAWAAAEAAERGQAIAGAGLRLAIEEHDQPSRADIQDQPGPEWLPLTSVRYMPDEPTGKCDKCGAPGSMVAMVRPYGGQWQCIDKDECRDRKAKAPTHDAPWLCHGTGHGKSTQPTFDVPGHKGRMTTEQIAEWLNSNPADPMSYSVVKPGHISAMPPRVGSSGSVEVDAAYYVTGPSPRPRRIGPSLVGADDFGSDRHPKSPPKYDHRGAPEVITTEPLEPWQPPPLCSGCGYPMLIYEDYHRCPDCNITIPPQDLGSIEIKMTLDREAMDGELAEGDGPNIPRHGSTVETFDPPYITTKRRYDP